MASLTGTFTVANQVSTDLAVGPGQAANVILTQTGGSMLIRVEVRDGAAWRVVGTHTASTAGTTYVNTSPALQHYRLLAYTAVGTSVAYTLADVTGEAQERWFNGETQVAAITDAGFSGDLVGDVTGNVTGDVTGTVTGAVVPPASLGTAGTGVTAVVTGAGNFRTAVLTLTDVVLPIVSVTTGNGVGGVTIYTAPEGYIYTLGCVAALTWNVATGQQADFTDNTPEGDLGIGTLAPANADALGTDATDDNLATAAAITGTAFAGAVNLASEAPLAYDGSATAMPVVLTGLIDAADIDNDVSSSIRVSGTVTLNYILRGDVTAP